MFWVGLADNSEARCPLVSALNRRFVLDFSVHAFGNVARPFRQDDKEVFFVGEVRHLPHHIPMGIMDADLGADIAGEIDFFAPDLPAHREQFDHLFWGDVAFVVEGDDQVARIDVFDDVGERLSDGSPRVKRRTMFHAVDAFADDAVVLGLVVARDGLPDVVVI